MSRGERAALWEPFDFFDTASAADRNRRSAAEREPAHDPPPRAKFNAVARSLKPEAAWNAVQLGFAEILDVRTEIERRRYGAPPGARPVSLARHVATPEGPGSVYLCQHALRSKLTLRRGAAEVAGGFAAWTQAGLPIEEVD